MDGLGQDSPCRARVLSLESTNPTFQPQPRHGYLTRRWPRFSLVRHPRLSHVGPPPVSAAHPADCLRGLLQCRHDETPRWQGRSRCWSQPRCWTPDRGAARCCRRHGVCDRSHHPLATLRDGETRNDRGDRRADRSGGWAGHRSPSRSSRSRPGASSGRPDRPRPRPSRHPGKRHLGCRLADRLGQAHVGVRPRQGSADTEAFDRHPRHYQSLCDPPC